MATGTQFDTETFARLMRGSACLALRDIARAVTQLYNDTLAPTGLRVTHVGILRVCAASGPISIDGLARELETNRETISRSLKPLVDRGLVRRAASAGRKRPGLIELTLKGRRSLAVAIDGWDRAQHDVIDRLGEERWNWLRSQLSEIVGLTADAR